MKVRTYLDDLILGKRLVNMLRKAASCTPAKEKSSMPLSSGIEDYHVKIDDNDMFCDCPQVLKRERIATYGCCFVL